MPEITAQIIVEPIQATFVQNNSPLNVTVDSTTMSVYGGGFAPPGGNIYEIQFNDNGKFGGAPNTAVSNGNISFGNVANVKITGGTSGYYLQTDGSGNLTWAQGTANVSGNGTSAGANTQIQISDGTGNFVAGAGFTFDTASNIFTTPGDIATAGNINGVAIANSNITAVDITATGLISGDGSNISNVTVIGIANGSSNLAIPVLDGNVIISVGGQPDRLIVSTVGANVEGNIGATGNVDGNSINANLVNSVDANITANLDAYNLTANFISTSDLTVNSSLITLGTSAGNANTPSLGIAIGLGAGEANLGLDSVAIGSRAGNLDQANNSIILNATGANLTTSTANSFTVKPVRNDNTGNILYYDDTTGEITYDSAPATNQIANGTSSVSIPTVNGNVSFNINGIPNVTVMTAGGIETDTLDASYVVGNGYQMTGIEYSNIANTPTLGNVSSINLNGNALQFLNGGGSFSSPVVTTANVANYLALGGLSGTAIGIGANSAIQLGNAIAIGLNAASNTSFAQGTYAIAIGAEAGYQNQKSDAIAIGREAGYLTQESGAVAVGTNAGNDNQDPYAVALGYDAGRTTQGANAVAIGHEAGYVSQGANSIAIGAFAGRSAAQADDSIVINATGANLVATTANAMFVKPVRSVLGGGLPAGFKQVAYNPTTGEFIYYD